MSKAYHVAEVEIVRLERKLPGQYETLTEAWDALKGNPNPGVITLIEDGKEAWRLCQDGKLRDRWIKHVDGRPDEVVQISADGQRRVIRGK